MRKALISTLAVVAALTLVAAPASAQPRHEDHGGRGFGLAALAIGVVGAAVSAEIAYHERSEPECRTRTSEFYDDYGNLRGEKKVTICGD
jgi:hypothetical protein